MRYLGGAGGENATQGKAFCHGLGDVGAVGALSATPARPAPKTHAPVGRRKGFPTSPAPFALGHGQRAYLCSRAFPPYPSRRTQ